MFVKFRNKLAIPTKENQ